MKSALLCSFLATGLLFGHTHRTINQSTDQMSQVQGHLSGYDRVALRTSSPPVHLGGKHAKHAADRVVTDKRTINAFVPSGK